MSKTWLPLRKRSSALLFLVLAPLFAAAQLSVGPERAVSSPDSEVLSRTDQIDVASSGDTVLIVSTDYRTDRGAEIVATRLDRFAALREPLSIPLSSTAGVSEDGPLAQFDGEQLVVVWESDGNAMAAALDRNGELIQGPVVMAEGKPESLFMVGSQLLISIADKAGTTIYRVRDDLRLVDIVDFPRRQNAQVTRLGTGLLVVWPEFEYPTTRVLIKATRLDSRARVLSTVTVTELGTFNNGATIALESIGNDGIIAVASTDRFVVARMALDGTVTTLHVDESDNVRSVEDIVVRSDGFDLLMIIAGRPRVLRFTGNALTGENIPFSNTVESGRGIMVLGRVLTFWQVGGTITARYAFAGQNEFPFTISRGAPSQQLPALATSGSGVMALWAEDVDDTIDRMMGRLLTRDGTPVGSEISLGTRTMSPIASTPAVAYAAGNYIALWVDQRRGPDKTANLTMKTIDPGGVVGPEVTVTNGAHPTESPAIASDGSNALIVWTEKPLTGAQVRATFASSPTSKFDIPEMVSEPAAVYGNGSYLVAGTTALGGIRGILVSRTGAIERTLFDTAGTTDNKVALAWNGLTHYLVVFRRGTSIYARLLDRTGATIGSSFVITDSVADNPTVAWDGRAFVVAWTIRDINNLVLDGDIYAARIATNGAIDAPVAVAGTNRNDDFPTLVGLGNGTSLIGYQRMVEELVNVHRVFTRVVTTPATLTKRRAVR